MLMIIMIMIISNGNHNNNECNNNDDNKNNDHNIQEKILMISEPRWTVGQKTRDKKQEFAV